MRLKLSIAFTVLSLLTACGGGDEPGGGGASGSGGSGAGGGGNTAGGAGKPSNFGGNMHSGPMFAGAECPEDLGLPAAYGLPNLKGQVDGSNVRIRFDPQGDARDYRVYALPAKGDISGDAVKNAVYRCAGQYTVPVPAIDDAKMPENPGIRTRAESAVRGFARTAPDATLGYVFTTPADDRIPVYALGDPGTDADNVTCYFMRWPESRFKKYVTDEKERKELLAAHWRDDGIVFYVPKPGADGSEPIYTGLESNHRLYMKAGAEHDDRKGKGVELSEAFSVYSATRDGAEPLMRVYYEQTCARGHDELVAGMARFNKAWQQGAQPVEELHYSGLTEETTLVVEALDALCPFQGIVAASARPARSDPHEGFTIDYPAFQTLDELAAASDTGEVFINGQGDGTSPKAISRACIKVAPETPPEMDFRYDGSADTFSEPVSKGFQLWEIESPALNVQIHTVATDEWAVGNMLGELWVTYADWAADTNGKLRITPKQRATLAADSFVHASMEVDTVSTQRRYPQLLVGDVEWPVQDNLEQGSTVIVQTFGGITQALDVQLEFCDHRTWDVNNQCPMFDLYKLQGDDGEFLSPHVEINGLNGADRTVRFDAYVSTGRVYLYTNGIPYGCADLPAGKLKAGSGTVTFGDVLYHSGVDLEAWYPFHKKHMQTLTSRHFSNLAFSSNVAAPAWDEANMPCATALK